MIANPNNFNISLHSKPSFVESVRIVENDISILIKPGSSLALGDHSEEIIFSTGKITRKISITISVVNFISSDFAGELYYFALDKKKISITQSHGLARKVYMNIKMFFSAMGKSYTQEEEFQMSYFKGRADFYPGREIQDFFIKTQENMPTGEFIAYSLAHVEISFTERKNDNTVLKRYDLPKLYFAPGKKPKCFPLLTDHPFRRTFQNSKILVSSDLLSKKEDIQRLTEMYSEQKSQDAFKAMIKTFLFERHKFKPNFNNEVIVSGELSFVPFPEPNSLAHIFWMNQNLVFDWFTASGHHSILSEFEHAISDNYKDGRYEKYAAIQSDTLKINTGWMIAEEAFLIDDLLKSHFCIVEMEGKVFKCLPNNKKNEIKNSADNLFSMTLEFKILNDE